MNDAWGTVNNAAPPLIHPHLSGSHIRRTHFLLPYSQVQGSVLVYLVTICKEKDPLSLDVFVIARSFSLVSFLLSLSREPILPDSHFTADHRYSPPNQHRVEIVPSVNYAYHCPTVYKDFARDPSRCDPIVSVSNDADIHIREPLLVGQTPKVINNCEPTQCLDRGETESAFAIDSHSSCIVNAPKW